LESNQPRAATACPRCESCRCGRAALSDTEATALSLAGAAAVLALGIVVSIVSMRREARLVNGMYRQLALRLGGEFVLARGTGTGTPD
jgi:hypothetical protein